MGSRQRPTWRCSPAPRGAVGTILHGLDTSQPDFVRIPSGSDLVRGRRGREIFVRCLQRSRKSRQSLDSCFHERPWGVVVVLAMASMPRRAQILAFGSSKASEINVLGICKSGICELLRKISGEIGIDRLLRLDL